MTESWSDWFKRKLRETSVRLPGVPVRVTGRVLEQAGKQVAAGALETTVANSARRGDPSLRGYRPAIIEQPGAAAGLVATLINLARGREEPVPSERTYVGRSLARARQASEVTNRTLGVDYPRNTAESMLRAAGTIAVPGPKIPRVAASAPRAVRVLGNTGRIAAEVALPLRQGGVRTAAAATGIGTAVPEAINAVAPQALDNPVSGAKYEGIADVVGASNQNYDASSLDELMAQPASVDELALVVAEDESEIDGVMSGPIEESELDAVEDEEKAISWQEAGIAIGTALATFAAGKQARKYLATRVEQIKTDSVPSFIGKRMQRSRGSGSARLITAIAEQARPIYNAAEAFLSPTQAMNLRYKSDLINNVSIGARVAHQFRTGRMVGVPPRANGVPRKTVPLAPLAEAYAKELSLDEQRLVGDVLLAASALDDYRRTGTLAALNVTKDGRSMTPKELDDFVTQTRSDPRYDKYIKAIQKSYADLLEFRVARGTMSREAADELRRLRPNYVKMVRDQDTDVASGEARPYNANTDRGLGYARAEDESAGVQGGAVGNPLNVLFDQWQTEIRRAEINDVRNAFLSQMDSVGGGISAAGGKLVHRLPDGVRPNTTEGVHTVWEGGKTVSYKVNDPAISKALEFAPRATIQTLEALRQISQSLTTGPIGTLFNAFAVAKSTLYDTTLGSLLRPADVSLGLINETLSKINVNPPQAVTSMLSRLDPTTYVGAFTGAARYMWDDLRGAIAQNLSDQMIRDHSWLRTAIGDQNVVALRDTFAQAYENSIKSIMDQYGITSMTLHGTPDPAQVLTNMGDIAPHFDNAAAMQRQMEDGLSLMDSARGVNAYLGLRNTTIRRAYTGLLEAMHNGFRYSATATNVRRNANMDKLASQMRRLSADAAQHGGSDGVNKTLGSFMYANLSVQTLHETARAIRTRPVTFFANLTSLGMIGAALHYTALATDEAAREKHANKTPQQKAASITTFGGAEIPIDPLLRIPFGTAFAVLDHATGASTGQWDANMLAALNNLLSGDFAGEEYFEDASTALIEAARANNPLAPEAFPLTSAIQAYSGIDPAMTRFSGETAPVMTQRLSGFDEDKSQVDGLGSAYAENMIGAIFGSAGDNLWRIANDAARAYGDTHDVGTAVELGMGRYRDTLVRSSGTFKPILFGNYEQVYSVTDTNWQLMRARDAGIEIAAKIDAQNIRARSIEGGPVSGLGRQAAPLPSDRQSAGPQLIGTPLDTIAAHAAALKRDNDYFKQQLSALGKQAEATRGFYTTPQEERNRMVNEINEKRKYITLQMLAHTRSIEAMIQQQIGDPDFRFDDFDPEDYLQPQDSP